MIIFFEADARIQPCDGIRHRKRSCIPAACLKICAESAFTWGALASAWQGLLFRTFPRNAASAGRAWRSGMRRRTRNLRDRGDAQADCGFELLERDELDPQRGPKHVCTWQSEE